MFDISLAMNLAPVAVNASMTYTALYDMVRKCGLRHVVAVNHNNQVSKTGLNILPLNETFFPDGFSETINSSPVKKGFLKLDKFTCLFSISLLYLGSVPIRQRGSKV